MSDVLGLTRNQQLVMGALAAEAAPLSAYALLDRLRDDGLRAPLQIYRALEKLIEQGLVHKLETVSAFVACAHPHKHDDETVAFTICDKCGHVEEFADPDVIAGLSRHAKRRRFAVSRAIVELRGTCGACLAA